MKNVTSKVNNGRADTIVDIAAVETKYNAKYVGQFCLKTKYGSWATNSAEVFWQEKPPIEGYSNYFALLIQDGSLYITSGQSAVDGIINAVEAKDGEIIYSRHRWDGRYSTDGTVFIDGGRDYVRRSGGGPLIPLKIVDGEFYQVDEPEFSVDEDV